MSSMRLLLAGLLAAAAVVPAVASAGPVPAVRGVGIANVGADTPLAAIDADLAAAAAMGARTVRAEVSWAALSPVAPDEREAAYLERVDRLVAGARKRGIKPLLFLLRTPCWASSAPGAPESCPSDAEDYPPRQASDYADVAAWLARRYKGRLAGMEIWNEPDHASESYFKGPDKAERYTAIVKAANRALEAADPGLPVLAGSLVGADGRFLEALYAAGIKGHYDGLAVHYYDLTLASLRSIRAIQRRHGDRKPLWLSEFGYTSCFPAAKVEGEHKCVTAKQQARSLGDVFRALRGTGWIRAAIVYKLRDTATEHFGVMTSGGARKSAFATLRTAFRSGLGAPRAIRASVGGGRLTGSAPAGDIVTIDAYSDAGAHLYHAVVAPDRFGRFALSLPGEVSGSKIYVAQPWTGRSAIVRG